MLESSIPTISVSQAITLCNGLLQDVTFRIEGEVANYSLSRGKFVFFDLKDEQAESRLSCFMMAYQLSMPLEDGMRVIIEGRPGLYPKNGGFRISVRRVMLQGEGNLKRAFELLKKRLETEGLFAPERKRTLPRFPEKVGIISSRDAAGFRDFMTIVNNRLPGVHFYFAHVAVQGVDAEKEICAALTALNERDLDALVLVRGGGSLEDLHAFNSEPVARAIVRSRVPIIVGIGHEQDLTIADLCADVRASTPSNAAELLVPTVERVQAMVREMVSAGRYCVAHTIDRKSQWIAQIRRMSQQRLSHEISTLEAQIHQKITLIEAASPESVLRRGFSIAYTSEGKVVTSKSQVVSGERIVTHVTDGEIVSTVI